MASRTLFREWENATPTYVPSEAFYNYLPRYFGSRPYNLATLNAAYSAFQTEQASHERRGLLGLNQPSEPEAPTAESLENLTDEAVAQLFKGVQREAARR